MEQVKKLRTVYRTAFTRVANQLENLIKMEDRNLDDIQVAWEMLQQKAESLKESDKELFNLLLEEDTTTEDELNNEISSTDEYSSKFVKFNLTCQKILQKDAASVVSTHASYITTNIPASHKMRLPVLEFKKFGGDVKDWLSFWSQFKKIDEDTDMPLEDKFQYLIQATIPGTRAREVVDSFPPIAKNYSKAVKALKSRFGRDEFLVEYYVRELLKLVLHNVTCKNSKNLSTLYDKIETQLRALDTLGVTTDKCTSMLYPLVESCLPEDLLRVWQRSSEFSKNQDSTTKSRLDALIAFLKAEVEGEERILLAIEGFGLHQDNEPRKQKSKSADVDIPTATGLLTNQIAKCIFCDGKHNSHDCFKAQKLTLCEKKTILTKHRACFNCLKTGHQSKKCGAILQCIVCSRRHVTLMCPNLTANTNDVINANKELNDEHDKPTIEKNLANHVTDQVFLQTLRIKIRSDEQKEEVRAIIDSGSQKSYILHNTAKRMGYIPKRSENIIHSLFGGTNTEEQTHNCYDIRLLSLDEKYACRFEALDHPVICNNISSVFDGEWSKGLKKLNISLSDVKDSEPIEILIGADVAGKLLTGRRQILKCGLVAVETYLGWTLMGRTTNKAMSSIASMIVTTGVPECDAIENNDLNRRVRYRQKLREDLRRRFRTRNGKLLRPVQRLYPMECGNKDAVEDILERNAAGEILQTAVTESEKFPTPSNEKKSKRGRILKQTKRFKTNKPD